MSNLFKENGFLTEDGEKVLHDLNSTFCKLFEKDDVKDLTSSQLRILSSNIFKIFGDKFFDEINFKNKIK